MTWQSLQLKFSHWLKVTETDIDCPDALTVSFVAMSTLNGFSSCASSDSDCNEGTVTGRKLQRLVSTVTILHMAMSIFNGFSFLHCLAVTGGQSAVLPETYRYWYQLSRYCRTNINSLQKKILKNELDCLHVYLFSSQLCGAMPTENWTVHLFSELSEVWAII